MELDAHGDSSIEGRMGLFFSTDDFTVEVTLPFTTSGLLFGAVSKKTYYGTYYTHEAFDKIVTKENEFLTGL